ncbi:hypothetical protein DZA50_06400 [Kangiella sp. HD9-110m-PIT-SAG07]|nr:hypothetical protein DZA50_06400 [Kangiella sp. HD9-110m-PIT-SAG07]
MAKPKLGCTYRMENHKTIIKKCLLTICFLFCSTKGVAFNKDSNGWIPFDGEGGNIVLNVTMNAQPAKVLLDTGASIHTLTSKMAEKANISSNHARAITLIGLNGKVKAPLSGTFDLAADGQIFSLRDIPIIQGSHSFDMILGRTFFEQSVVQVDYPNQRIRFLDSDAVNFNSNVEVRYDLSGRLLIESYIKGNKGWMLLDTGSNTFAVLKRDFVFQNDLDEFALGVGELEVAGISETGEFNVIELDDFKLGPYRFDSFVASYNKNYQNSLDSKTRRVYSRIPVDNSILDGILGYDILKNFIVTFDYSKKKIHLYLPQPQAAE